MADSVRPTAILYLTVKDIVGLEAAAVVAIIVGIALSFAASTLFLPIDRFALNLSRRMCRRSLGDARPSKSCNPIAPVSGMAVR